MSDAEMNSSNKTPMLPFRKIITTTACCLAAAVGSSCTNFCGRFIDMGQVHSAIEITKPEEMYRVGNRRYIRGVSADFEYRSNWVMDNLKSPGGEYVRIPGSEKGNRYHEVVLDPDDEGEHYILKPDAEWTTGLPGEPSGMTVSYNTKRYHRICDKKTETTAHAVYAYPLAAVAFVAVDVPTAIISSACAILTAPYILVEEALD